MTDISRVLLDRVRAGKAEENMRCPKHTVRTDDCADCDDEVSEGLNTPEEQNPAEPTPEEMKSHMRLRACALAMGYNELAKYAKQLGEKVYFRIARREALKDFIAKGGNTDLFADEPGVMELELPDGLPFIKFKESDIELMRKTVADHDAQRTFVNEHGVSITETVDRPARVTAEAPSLVAAVRAYIDAEDADRIHEFDAMKEALEREEKR